MNPVQFDTVTRLFASRRSRRRALVAAGGGLAALRLAHGASAQEATPFASPAPAGGSTTDLFVQSFDSGSLAPKEGEDGVFVLALHGEHGRTIAFSDRPARVVVSVPTQQFLDGLGFTLYDPPNAALVMEPASGETDVIVLELLNPRHDEVNRTLTYDVRILDTFSAERGLSFQETPRPPDPAGESFGLAQLFIDGCPTLFACYKVVGDEGQFVGMLPGGPVPTCTRAPFSCQPDFCDPPGPGVNDLARQCNATYSQCDGGCYPL